MFGELTKEVAADRRSRAGRLHGNACRLIRGRRATRSDEAIAGEDGGERLQFIRHGIPFDPVAMQKVPSGYNFHYGNTLSLNESMNIKTYIAGDFSLTIS